MKFAIDCMLGKLAKWLKIFGFDVVFFSKIEDQELLSIAENEGRILLTRDTGLLDKAKHITSLFIQSEYWKDQVRQVLQEFDLSQKVKPYSRCLDCNQQLKNLPQNRAKNLVIPFIYKTADTFAICTECGRVFWRGTHYEDMKTKIEKILKE